MNYIFSQCDDYMQLLYNNCVILNYMDLHVFTLWLENSIKNLHFVDSWLVKKNDIHMQFVSMYVEASLIIKNV